MKIKLPFGGFKVRARENVEFRITHFHTKNMHFGVNYVWEGHRTDQVNTGLDQYSWTLSGAFWPTNNPRISCVDILFYKWFVKPQVDSSAS